MQGSSLTLNLGGWFNQSVAPFRWTHSAVENGISHVVRHRADSTLLIAQKVSVALYIAPAVVEVITVHFINITV